MLHGRKPHRGKHCSHLQIWRIWHFFLLFCIHQLKRTNDSWSSFWMLQLPGSLCMSARWLAVAQVDFSEDNLFLLMLKRDSSSEVNHSSAALFSSSPGSPPALTSPLRQPYLYRHPLVSSRLLCSSCFVSFIFLPLLPTVSQGLQSFILLQWVNCVVKPIAHQRYAPCCQSEVAKLLPNIYINNYSYRNSQHCSVTASELQTGIIKWQKITPRNLIYCS